MGKKSKVEDVKKAGAAAPVDSLFGNPSKIDSSLASLFATQTTPEPTSKDKSRSKQDKIPHVKSSKERTKKRTKKRAASSVIEEEKSAEEEAHQDGDDDLSSIDEEFDDEASVAEVEAEVGDTATPPKAEESEINSRRKRKRDDEDLEGKYMDRLAKEEEKEDAKRAAERQSKRQKSSAGPTSSKPETNGPDTESDTEMAEDKSESEEDFEVPQHESLAQTPDTEIEKANRTVFLGNVSSDAVTSKKSKKALIQHMSSFLDAMNTGGKDDKKKKDEKADEKHKFESIRFRSTAYTNMLPKKASFVTQDLMDSTTKSTNAYVVYSTQAASRAALKLNGTTVLGRHLRVDSVAHPSKSDPKRCVFVGNLGFVDDDSAIQAADAEEGKKKPRKRTPSDIEEGLWREFGKCGAVENVRVVRDSKTRIGKGIAYVQFMDENSVEAALLYNDKRFPPMLPRKLRVSRAKGIKRNVAKQNTWSRPATNGVYNPKINDQQKSAMGRASKLLGRAGAAMINQSGTSIPKLPAKASDLKAPESFVFEGHRATRGSGSVGKKVSAKTKGRPDNRSSRRAKEWKFGGGGDK